MCERDSSSSLSVCEDAKRYFGCSSKISSSDIPAVLGMSSKFQILTDSILVVCWLIVEPKDVIHFAVSHFLKNTHDLILTIIQVLWLLLLVASSGCIHEVHLGAQLNLINKFMLRLVGLRKRCIDMVEIVHFSTTVLDLIGLGYKVLSASALHSILDHQTKLKILHQDH